MANVKISNLTAATTPVAGTEVLPIVQSGATVKVSIANLTAGRSVSATGLALAGSTSGTVTLAAKAVAGSTTFRLPAADGTSGQAMVTDGSGNLSFATSSATPGGSTTQVQYNNAGAFAGSANLIFDGSNLGVGVTPSAWSVGTAIQVKRASFYTYDTSGLEISQNAAVISGAWQRIGADFATKYEQGSGKHIWYNAVSSTAGSAITWLEHVRITAGGYFKASDTGTYLGSTDSYHELRQSDAGNSSVIISCTNGSYTGQAVQLRMTRNTTNDTFYVLRYFNEGAGAYKFNVADSGNVTNTNGSYGAISDVKMKTDIVDAGSQWADIKAIRFRKYKMKDDPSDLVQLGVIAQELEQISPGLISEHKDIDGDGVDLGTTTKSVKTSVLFMKAVKALQEAMIRIEEQQIIITQLQADVSALKGS